MKALTRAIERAAFDLKSRERLPENL